MPRVRKSKKNGEKRASKQMENFFAADCDELIWDSNGYGYLPGSAMRFRRNDYGLIELYDTNSIDIEELIQNGGNSSDASTADGRTICELCCSEILICNSFESQGRFCIPCAPKYFRDCDSRELDLLCRAGSNARTLEAQISTIAKSDGRSESSVDSNDQSTSMFGRKRKLRMIDGETVRLPSKREKNDKVCASETEEFSWEEYLQRSNSVPAPHALFPQVERGFPETKFEQGSMLEGIDPNHENLYCVLSVAEVIGQRLRLHFEGYSEKFDFWTNSNSPFIFPVSWCKRNGKKLCPPRGYSLDGFLWDEYLALKKAKMADPRLFKAPDFDSHPSHEFKIGRKLEAVDKRNPEMICVATIADCIGDFVLIHFDGWHTSFDQWAHVESPFLLPVGHCEDFGKMLALPSTWSEDRLEEFTWELYLREERAEAVPTSAFKDRRPPFPFEKGMKLEAVDRRCPRLLRIASVVEVDNYHIVFRYDGWPEKYNQVVEDDCPDIYPISYCSTTGHPLQAPPGFVGESSNSRTTGGCPTLGCRGIGHVKGPKFTSHSSLSGCPYSDVNMKNERFLDRFAEAAPLNPRRRGNGPLNRKKIIRQLSDPTNNASITSRPSLNSQPVPTKTGKPRGRPRKYNIVNNVNISSISNVNVSSANNVDSVSSINASNISNSVDIDSNTVPFADNAIVQPCALDVVNSPHSQKSSPLVISDTVDSCPLDLDSSRAVSSASSQSCSWSKADMLAAERSVMEPKYEPYSLVKEERRIMQHIRDVLGIELPEDIEDVIRWSALRVSTFVSSVLNSSRYSRRIVHEEIDGDAFLKLEQVDMQLWDMPLGHSTKLTSVIQYFRLKLKIKDVERINSSQEVSPSTPEQMNSDQRSNQRIFLSRIDMIGNYPSKASL